MKSQQRCQDAEEDDFEPYEKEPIEVHLSFDQARVFQGLLSVRYMHMRQKEELKRSEVARLNPQSQALREGLKSSKTEKHTTQNKTSGEGA